MTEALRLAREALEGFREVVAGVSWGSHSRSERRALDAISDMGTALAQMDALAGEEPKPVRDIHGALRKVFGMLNDYAERPHGDGHAAHDPMAVLAQVYADLAAHWAAFDDYVTAAGEGESDTRELGEAANASHLKTLDQVAALVEVAKEITALYPDPNSETDAAFMLGHAQSLLRDILAAHTKEGG